MYKEKNPHYSTQNRRPILPICGACRTKAYATTLYSSRFKRLIYVVALHGPNVGCVLPLNSRVATKGVRSSIPGEAGKSIKKGELYLIQMILNTAFGWVCVFDLFQNDGKSERESKCDVYISTVDFRRSLIPRFEKGWV